LNPAATGRVMKAAGGGGGGLPDCKSVADARSRLRAIAAALWREGATGARTKDP